MAKFIDFTRGKRWYVGTITVNYNLKWLLLPFVLLWYLLLSLMKGLKWLGKKAVVLFRKFWKLLLLFWAWFTGLFKSRTPKEKVSEKKQDRPWFWLLLLLLLLAFGLLLFRQCSSEPTQEEDSIEAVYTQAFDSVVVASTYLNGVRGNADANSSCPLALVGFKFINGRPASEFNFSGKSYDESVKIIADSWRPFVLENVKVSLTKQQMTVVVLTAMRMGNAGFRRSTFLQKVNAGDFEEAANWFVLQDKSGKVVETGSEPKLYFNVLRLMWNGEVSVNDLVDMPILSYKKLDANKVYTAAEMLDVMRSGNGQTPRQALGL